MYLCKSPLKRTKYLLKTNAHYSEFLPIFQFLPASKNKLRSPILLRANCSFDPQSLIKRPLPTLYWEPRALHNVLWLRGQHFSTGCVREKNFYAKKKVDGKKKQLNKQSHRLPKVKLFTVLNYFVFNVGCYYCTETF